MAPFWGHSMYKSTSFKEKEFQPSMKRHSVTNSIQWQTKKT
jgi:hypothetical protein